ncbi:TPA: hypothetical protein ACSK9D_003147, partial [Listeria innocua]
KNDNGHCWQRHLVTLYLTSNHILFNDDTKTLFHGANNDIPVNIHHLNYDSNIWNLYNDAKEKSIKTVEMIKEKALRDRGLFCNKYEH